MIDLFEQYKELGISPKVYKYCENVLKCLKDRFEAIDSMAEFNQLKVLRAMQENRVA